MGVGLRVPNWNLLSAFPIMPWVVSVSYRIFFWNLAQSKLFLQSYGNSLSLLHLLAGLCQPTLSACFLGLFQGTNRQTDCFHIRSHGFGLSGDAKQTENFVNVLLPSPCIFHLSSFLCCLTSPMSHLGIRHVIRERGRAWCGCVLVFLVPGKYFPCIGGNFRMLKILKRPEPVLHWENIRVFGGKHSKTQIQLGLAPISFHASNDEGHPFFFPFSLTVYPSLCLFLYHLGYVDHCYIYCAAILSFLSTWNPVLL